MEGVILFSGVLHRGNSLRASRLTALSGLARPPFRLRTLGLSNHLMKLYAIGYLFVKQTNYEMWVL